MRPSSAQARVGAMSAMSSSPPALFRTSLKRERLAGAHICTGGRRSAHGMVAYPLYLRIEAAWRRSPHHGFSHDNAAVVGLWLAAALTEDGWWAKRSGRAWRPSLSSCWPRGGHGRAYYAPGHPFRHRLRHRYKHSCALRSTRMPLIACTPYWPSSSEARDCRDGEASLCFLRILALGRAVAPSIV